MTNARTKRPFKPACLTLMMLTTITAALSQDKGADAGMSAFGRMVPAGFISRGVRIPTFDSLGKPSSLLTAATLQRLDDDRLHAENVAIEIYALRADQTIRVDLLSAVHHMADQILRSGERSKVSRTDFEVQGDSLVFDAVSSVGSMKGRVRTLIFDTSALSGQSEGSPQPRK